MIKLSIGDICVIQDEARKYLNSHIHLGRLPDMTRDLSLGEMRALAFVEAVTMILNRNGAFKDGWLVDNQVDLEYPNSEAIEPADWPEDEEKK
jgi:hypothetical protein